MSDKISFFISRNIAFISLLACLLLTSSCEFTGGYKPSKYSSEQLIQERRKKLEEYGNGNYSNDDYYIPPNNYNYNLYNKYNNGSYYYPYYEDNDSFYQNTNRYPSYDPNADNNDYYYDNYNKMLPNNLDSTFPIYFD